MSMDDLKLFRLYGWSEPMTKTCKTCGRPIPAARLEALPDTEFCVVHSLTQKHQGLMVSSHKTGSEFSFLPTDPEQRRQALNAHRRKR